METSTRIDSETITRFGEQWNFFTTNADYYGSVQCLADICGPNFDVKNFQGKHICDIGSGTGRIVKMLLNSGADFVTAIEPSSAFKILKENTADVNNQVNLINSRAEELTIDNQFDFVTSFGVIHHIVDPIPTVKMIYKSLKPGGKCVIWVYGYEGNELYLSIFTRVRKITTRVSQKSLLKISRALVYALNAYIQLCRYLPLPMRDYMQNHIGKLSQHDRILTIYDQLNPTYAKYYKKDEAYALLADHGFSNVQLYHRHGYSWTLTGDKSTFE